MNTDDQMNLGEILQAALRQPPRMEYQDRKRYHYVGTAKISAIKALRRLTGLTLKSAKNAVEWEGGIMLTNSQIMVLQRLYVEEVTASQSDWQEIIERPAAITL
jgi:hypothetical protein